jgi:hypothetical protein
MLGYPELRSVPAKRASTAPRRSATAEGLHLSAAHNANPDVHPDSNANPNPNRDVHSDSDSIAESGSSNAMPGVHDGLFYEPSRSRGM